VRDKVLLPWKPDYWQSHAFPLSDEGAAAVLADKLARRYQAQLAPALRGLHENSPATALNVDKCQKENFGRSNAGKGNGPLYECCEHCHGKAHLHMAECTIPSFMAPPASPTWPATTICATLMSAGPTQRRTLCVSSVTCAAITCRTTAAAAAICAAAGAT
jgi:hypothetical protein